MTPADILCFPEIRQIPLSKGLFAIVDAENYEWLMQWEWSVVAGRNTWYAARRATKRDGAIGSVRMHRVIMVAPAGMDVDHRNGNGLINIRENLRVCTESQNSMNGGSRRNSSSKYKGVHWCKTRKNGARK
jgi:hypothetical protein